MKPHVIAIMSYEKSDKLIIIIWNNKKELKKNVESENEMRRNIWRMFVH